MFDWCFYFKVIIFFKFIILKFITMFLPVNMRKFCKQYHNFYSKWYIWKQPFKGFPKNSNLILGRLEEFPWRGASFPVKLQAVYLPFWWKWAPSQVFPKYFAYFIFYCVNSCFWGAAISGCFITLMTLFILIYLTCKQGFLESSVCLWIFW